MAAHSAFGARRAYLQSRLGRLILICSAGLLLACPGGGLGQETRGAGAALDGDDWITINKDYSGQRFVDLDQITPANVGDLKEVCEIELNEPNLFSSGLLKIGRTLYASTVRQTVAFDAATCAVRWRQIIVFKRTPAATNHHGLGYLEGRIFRGTTDGRLIAYDARTGAVLWDVTPADPTKHEAFTSAPIAWQGRVFIGIATSDLGIAGRLMAFDTKTGEQLWSFDTTLGAPAGGGFWSTYTLDPRTGEVFGPVANPSPDFSRKLAPNDKVYTQYTNSVISIDALSGQLNWSYQVVPGDEHDWDLSPAPTLYRAPGVNGREMVAVTGKSGRVYGIDRATRLLAFDTPATTLVNDQMPLDRNWTYVCPGVQGGAMFSGTAYDPLSGALYVGMADHCAWFLSNPRIPETGGVVVKDWPAAAKLRAPRGWITAIDGISGAVLWRYQAPSQVLAGLVPTKGGLLFGGDTHGNLLVFNAATGALLNRINAKGALNSGLISYAVDGVQYLAAAVGGSTENPSTVAGPLRVSVYGLNGSDQPKVVSLERVEPSPSPGVTASQAAYAPCSQCHGGGMQAAVAGSSAPPIGRQSQLADPALLKEFLATVPPPMPRLYPGLLTEHDVELIAAYLQTDVFKCGPNEPQSCKPPAAPTTGGTPAWQAVYSVLTSPRCINCHPAASPQLPPAYFDPATNRGYPQDYPRQGDDRHPHYFTVLRGDTFPFETAEGTGKVYPGLGTPFERCTFCHGAENDTVTGIPGATNSQVAAGQPFWFLAPTSMAWESAPGVAMNGARLCAALLEKTRNGNRTPKDLLHHLATEPLVRWSFHPGTRPNGEPRTTPPISQDELLKAFQQWIDEGTPCPSG
jgi:alcohol dehydrogenase (cytochrome c)